MRCGESMRSRERVLCKAEDERRDWSVTGVKTFFFFKQKTTYEFVSRDWSSDVCSSDLGAVGYNISIP